MRMHIEVCGTMVILSSVLVVAGPLVPSWCSARRRWTLLLYLQILCVFARLLLSFCLDRTASHVSANCTVLKKTENTGAQSDLSLLNFVLNPNPIRLVICYFDNKHFPTLMASRNQNGVSRPFHSVCSMEFCCPKVKLRWIRLCMTAWRSFISVQFYAIRTRLHGRSSGAPAGNATKRAPAVFVLDLILLRHRWMFRPHRHASSILAIASKHSSKRPASSALAASLPNTQNGDATRQPKVVRRRSVHVKAPLFVVSLL